MIKIGVCGFGTVEQSFVNHVITYMIKYQKTVVKISAYL